MAAEERLSRMDAIRVEKVYSDSVVLARQAPWRVARLVNTLFNRSKMFYAIIMERHRLERFTLPSTISSSRQTKMTRVKRGYVKPTFKLREKKLHVDSNVSVLHGVKAQVNRHCRFGTLWSTCVLDYRKAFKV